MKPIHVAIFGLAFATTGLAQALVLDDGACQLIRARDAGDSTGESRLSATVVTISHKNGKAFLSLDGTIETEIRTGDQRTMIVAVPYREDKKGAVAAELVFAGRSLDISAASSPSKRVEGEYRIIWVGHEEKGEFALYPIQQKSG